MMSSLRAQTRAAAACSWDPHLRWASEVTPPLLPPSAIPEASRTSTGENRLLSHQREVRKDADFPRGSGPRHHALPLDWD